MYLDEFQSKADICNEFRISDFDGTVLYARYEYGNYEGSAAVVYVHQGKFYLVEASHCSCHGLESEWKPEETTVETMRHILAKGRSWGFTGEAFAHILAVLDEYNLTDANGDTIACTMKLRYG